MARPKKLTKQVQKFICARLAEGINISDQCKQFPDKLPKHPSQIYREASQNPEFADELNRAYTVYYMGKSDELEYYSSPEYLDELITQYGKLSVAKAAQQVKIKGIEYAIKHVAPIVSNRWDKSHKVEVKGDIGPQIVINDFFKPEISSNSDSTDDTLRH